MLTPNNCQIPNVGGFISKEHLDLLPITTDTLGSWGLLSWEISYDVTESDISQDFLRIKLMFFGSTIINENFSETNPEIDINLTISGVGLACTIGVDFTNNLVFLKGTLNFVVYSKQFDITLLKF